MLRRAVADKSEAELRTATDADLREAFARVDTDGSGYVSVDELRRAAAFLGFPVDDSDAEFGKMDSNGDGKASFEEFAAWWNASDARLHRHFALDPGGKKRTQSNTSGAFLG